MHIKKSKVKSFYLDLEMLTDYRDKRGKRYYLPYIIGSFILGILVGRNYMSSIHRYMENHMTYLNNIFSYRKKRVVSLNHLPKILNEVDWQEVNSLTMKHFGVKIEQLEEEEWVAIDGKVLRGSLMRDKKGNKAKQGEVQINAVKQENGQILYQTYYNGSKESEITHTRTVLSKSGLDKKSVTLDALHTVPKTLGQIASNSGRYLVQVKENQEILLEVLKKIPDKKPIMYTSKTEEKGHGRKEERSVCIYDIRQEGFDKRWKPSKIASLVLIKRDFLEVKTSKRMKETSYYITNQVVNPLNAQVRGLDLFNAVRGHWMVENHHQIKDVTFKEDDVKTKFSQLNRVMASLRSTAFEIVRKTAPKNFKAQIELFSDKPKLLRRFLKKIGFL